MFGDVVKKVCEKELGHEIVAEASDGIAAVAEIRAKHPDLVLLDLQLPHLDGFGVVEEVRQFAPETLFLAISSHCDAYTVFRTEQAGLHGFVDKNTSTVESLKQAIQSISEGRYYFSDSFRAVRSDRHYDTNSFDKLLTERERVILTLIAEPQSDDEIALRFAISANTAKKHRFNILRKLGLQTTHELVRYAREHGFNLQGTHSAPLRAPPAVFSSPQA
jgi:two-component system nitrate/nitrite response regulator NarL